MEFRIGDTFNESLAKLTGDEQKAVKTAAFDLQINPAHPGLQFHKLDKPKDPRFWAVRVSLDVRLIVHKTETSLLLCYVNHHDNAYHWAERRKLERIRCWIWTVTPIHKFAIAVFAMPWRLPPPSQSSARCTIGLTGDIASPLDPESDFAKVSFVYMPRTRYYGPSKARITKQTHDIAVFESERRNTAVERGRFLG